jgi:lysozyme
VLDDASQARLVELVKRFEGFSPVPYICPAGYWTRGFGILCKEDAGAITLAEGEAELEAILPAYVAHACRLSPGLEGNRLVAVADFVFNLGPTRYASSTLRRRVNSGDWPGARTEIRRWVFGGGRKLPGLILRREAEAALL